MDEKDLQEKLENSRFSGVYAKIDANYELVNLKQDTNHKETTLILNQILEQTKKTNGRVTKLEDTTACKDDVELLKTETQFTRTLTKYPKLAGLALVGIIVVGIAGGVIGIIKIF